MTHLCQKLVVAAGVGLGLAGVEVNPAQAAVVKLTPVADARVSDTDGDGVFESISTANIDRDFGLVVRQFQDFTPTVDFEDRAVIEFDLSSVPTDIAIDTLTFDFRTTAFTSSSNTVTIFGYIGDGVVSLDDATVKATSLGSYNVQSLGLGQQSVPLEASLLQPLLSQSSFLGLRLQGTDPTVNTSIASLENNSPPTLTVQFQNEPEAVPEPLTILGSATAIGFGVLLKREHSKKQRNSL